MIKTIDNYFVQGCIYRMKYGVGCCFYGELDLVDKLSRDEFINKLFMFIESREVKTRGHWFKVLTFLAPGGRKIYTVYERKFNGCSKDIFHDLMFRTFERLNDDDD